MQKPIPGEIASPAKPISQQIIFAAKQQLQILLPDAKLSDCRVSNLYEIYHIRPSEVSSGDLSRATQHSLGALIQEGGDCVAHIVLRGNNLECINEAAVMGVIVGYIPRSIGAILEQIHAYPEGDWRVRYLLAHPATAIWISNKDFADALFPVVTEKTSLRIGKRYSSEEFLRELHQSHQNEA